MEIADCRYLEDRAKVGFPESSRYQTWSDTVFEMIASSNRGSLPSYDNAST